MVAARAIMNSVISALLINAFYWVRLLPVEGYSYSHAYCNNVWATRRQV